MKTHPFYSLHTESFGGEQNETVENELTEETSELSAEEVALEDDLAPTAPGEDDEEDAK